MIISNLAKSESQFGKKNGRKMDIMLIFPSIFEHSLSLFLRVNLEAFGLLGSNLV